MNYTKKVSLKTTAKCNPLTHSVVMYEDIFFYNRIFR